MVNFITETLPNTLSVVGLFLGAFFYLMRMDFWLAVITVAILPLFFAVSRIYVAQMRKYTRRVRSSDSQVQSLLTEAVQNRMLIKTLEASDRMVDRLGDTQTALRWHVRQRTKFSIASTLFVNGGFSVGYLVAFLWGAVRLSARTITFGQPCGVRLTDVTYAYEDSDLPVLNRLSFDFRPGTCTAILGETGAGKTTLVRLILALVRPQQGTIEIYSGQSGDPGTSRYSVSPLHRCNFVYVPQGNTLLSGTIRDNLLMGRPDATDDELWSVLHLVCGDFVAALPQGLDTVCTEAGGGLSEGQAQRIAIARALLRNRSVMLFDEATSALDPDTERQLLGNILSDRSKTVIFITHRPAVVDYCDQVLRVE